jgi:hypothetical protein
VVIQKLYTVRIKPKELHDAELHCYSYSNGVLYTCYFATRSSLQAILGLLYSLAGILVPASQFQSPLTIPLP